MLTGHLFMKNNTDQYASYYPMPWDQAYLIKEALRKLDSVPVMDADADELELQIFLKALLRLMYYPLTNEMEAAVRRYIGADLTDDQKYKLEIAGV